MSNNSPEPQSTEEVDLGQLFKLIGKAFDRFFKFIGNLLNKFFLAFVWIVFFIKRHFIKIAIAGVIGFALGLVKQKIAEPIYKSEIVIKQNYNTGENLYRSIEYINQLISEQDSMSLANNLSVTPNKAKTMLGFEVEPILNDNQRMSLFDEYTKSLDSVLATNIDFDTYVENYSDYSFSRQKITLWTKSKESSNGIVSSIINNVETLDYFKNEQKKDLAELNRREEAIKASLKQSDSLQQVYQTVLIKSVEANTSGSQTSVTIDNTDNKNITKEFELYKSDLDLRRELVSIERAKEDKEFIIEIISSKQVKGVLYNSTSLFGFELNHKIKYSILLVLLIGGLLFAIEFFSFLEKYKNTL